MKILVLLLKLFFADYSTGGLQHTVRWRNRTEKNLIEIYYQFTHLILTLKSVLIPEKNGTCHKKARSII